MTEMTEKEKNIKKKEQMLRIGEMVRSERIQKDISPTVLCRKAGLPSVDALTALEEGRYLPCQSRMDALASALSLDVNGLMAEEPAANTVRAPKNSNKANGKADGKFFRLNAGKMRDLRAREKMTQKDVAELLGVSRASAYQWEHNARNISARHLNVLSEYFDVPVQELISNRPENKAVLAISVQEAANTGEDRTREASAAACDVQVKKAERTSKVPQPADIPEEAEKVFCRNILFYMEEDNVSEEDLMAKTGLAVDVIRQTAKTGERLALSSMLKAAALFGKNVEDVICDNSHDDVLLKEYEELKVRVEKLKEMLGIS